jgi:hypothetical protein
LYRLPRFLFPPEILERGPLHLWRACGDAPMLARLGRAAGRRLGIPPGEYLGRWRIALGARLLRQGMPVKLASSRARSPD